MKKKICAGLVLFAVAGAFVWSLAPQPVSPRLADGSFIDVNSVSRGTNHPTRWGGVWRDYARKCLPTRYVNRLTPSLQASRGFPTNCTVIWFRRWRTNAQDWLLSDVVAPYECVLFDAQGQRRAGSPLMMVNFSLPPNGEGRALGFAVFPPVTGRQTIHIQRKPGMRGKDPLAATNPPVEFVVEVP